MSKESLLTGPYEIEGRFRFGGIFAGKFTAMGYCAFCEGHPDAMSAAAHYQQFREDQRQRDLALERRPEPATPSPLSGALGRAQVVQRECPDCGAVFGAISAPALHYEQMRCSDCQEQTVAEEDEREAQRQERAARVAAAAVWADCGVEQHHLAESFGTFRLDGVHASVAAAHQRAAAWAEAYQPKRAQRGLLFTGPAGSGKTHLAVAIGRRVVERMVPTLDEFRVDIVAQRDHLAATLATDPYQPTVQAQRHRAGLALPNEYTVQFWEAPKLLGQLQDGRYMGTNTTKKSEEQLYQHVAACRLPIIDDLGRVKSKGQRDEQPDMWFRIFNGFYTAERPMIGTTNYDIDDLVDVVGTAVVDRMWEMFDFVEMTGDSFRPRKRG